MATEPGSIVSQERLETLLDSRLVRDALVAFTEVTGLPVTVRDGHGRFFGSPTAQPQWCSLLRHADFGFEGCQRAAVESCPREPGRTVVYVCHGAVRHLTAAAIVEGHPIAQFIMGPFVNLPLSDELVAEVAAASRVPVAALLASRGEIKWRAEPRARSAARLLAAIARAFGRIAGDSLEKSRLLQTTPGQAQGRRARAPVRMPSPHPRLLLVESDSDARDGLARSLEMAGFRVNPVGNGREALDRLSLALPDVVLLNPDLPDTPGLELCHLIHSFANVSIVILSSAGDEDSVVGALERYAEDYVVKPVSARVLAARLWRVVRRAEGYQDEADDADTIDERLVFHLSHREALVEGRAVSLTPTECRILRSLARRANHLVPTGLLLEEAWPDGDGDQTQLWVHVRSLRLKLEADPSAPRYLLTQRGLGYVLAKPVSPAAGQDHRDASARHEGDERARLAIPLDVDRHPQ